MNERVKRLKDCGFNPIHLFGCWYLCRNKSSMYKKYSFYRPIRITESER